LNRSDPGSLLGADLVLLACNVGNVSRYILVDEAHGANGDVVTNAQTATNDAAVSAYIHIVTQRDRLVVGFD